MEFQSNPYLIWQLIPGIILLGIGLYIQSRPIKKRESNVFSAMMFGGSLWAFTNAIQLITPDIGWQKAWNSITYLGIMVIPTAWFLLTFKLTGFARERIDKLEKRLWVIPILLYLSLLTTEFHRFFFVSYEIVTVGGYASLENEYGFLFYVHTGYSYLLILSGMIVLGVSLATDFKRYGTQAYGLIIGVLAPLLGNAYFLFGSAPTGFPDPTPIIFTVTGISFAWAIFGGKMLDVVHLAHGAIIQKLSTGIIVLDSEKTILDINQAAANIFGVRVKVFVGSSLPELIEKNQAIAKTLVPTLEKRFDQEQEFQVTNPETGNTFYVSISRVEDQYNTRSGWLIQFSDISEQKQVEANLDETRRVYENVLDTLQDSYFEADPSGNITYANKAFVENLGFSDAQDVLGKHFRNFTDRKSVREIFEKFKTLYETKTPLKPFEYYYRTKDDRRYIGETSVSPILEGDKVVGARGLIRNITARVNAEREISEQKDLLDSLLQQSPIAMVINDMEKKISAVNPAFEELFGYSQEEALGNDLNDILSASEIQEETSRFTTLGMSERTSTVGRRKRKDGDLVDVEMFAAPLFVGGEQVGYLTFYHDISERLKAEADREKTQLTYRAVLDSLQDVYFEADPTGMITYVNQAFVSTIGYSSKDELIGKHFRHVSSRGSIRPVYENFKKVYETNQAIEPFEFVYRVADGTELTSEMVVSPIIEDGRAVGTRGIVRDISVRVKAEEVLREAKEAAEYRAGELATINRISETVSRSLNLDDILQSVCEELITIFDVRNAGIGFLTPDKTGLEIVAFHAIDPDETSALGMVLPFEGNPSSQEVIDKKRTIVIQDAQSDPRTSSLADISRSRGTKAIMIVPLLTRGEAIGTIGMPARDPDHVFRENEIELAETIASQIAAAIDNAQLHAKTEFALDVAERDLEIGRQIQSGFFPEELPKIPGWEIATHFHAARQVAGDFYDVFKFRDSNFTAFIIADVCDKGVGAALFMVLFRSLLRAFSERKIDIGNVQEQLLNIILNTNNFIAEYHGKSNMFATLFFGILDPDSGVLYYVNGGHEPPVILDKDGSIIQRLMPTGPAVGMFPDMEFNVEKIQLDKGDFLVGFTDGTTDAKNTSGNLFTEERLLKSIAVPWTSIFSMLFELNMELQKHIGGQGQFDDITLISFRRKLMPDTDHHAICRTAKLVFLEELRDFAENSAKYSGLSHEDSFAFKLAAEEMCTNIIQYGYEDREPGLLSLFFDVEDNKARLTIRDDGKYFSPDQEKTPDTEAGLDDRDIGGLGIYLVKEMMDNVTYGMTDANVNQLVLEKILK
jgi:sigma-B regulation protein RsbU (phosphoserine phosphatase)